MHHTSKMLKLEPMIFAEDNNIIISNAIIDNVYAFYFLLYELGISISDKFTTYRDG